MFMKREKVDAIRKAYPAGTKIEILFMEDVQAPPPGTKGTIVGVDDAGHILVSWENGSRLNIVFGEDVFKIIE